MTPKQIVLAQHPSAILAIEGGRYVIRSGALILGESHGGKGLAWREAAKAG